MKNDHVPENVHEFYLKKVAETALARTENLYAVTDISGKVLECNPFFEKILDKRAKANGRHMASLFSSETNFANAWDKYLASAGSGTPQLLNIMDTNGHARSYYCLFFRTENFIILCGKIDATEMSNLQIEILKLNNEMVNQARDLHKKNAELTRSNELKTRFLGMAAHDLRNPMGNILLLSEFVLEQPEHTLNEEQKQLLGHIQSLSKFSLKLLNEILDLAKLESGRVELEIEEHDIAQVIQSVVNIQKLSAAVKKIRIEYDMPGNLLQVKFDHDKIVQVLNNLVSNALKFSPSESVIVVTAKNDEGCVTVAVHDEGPGVEKSEADKIFLPFAQGKAKPTDKEPSTGLGLAIVKRIIDAHGGKVWFENTPRKGAIFYFSLPV